VAISPEDRTELKQTITEVLNEVIAANKPKDEGGNTRTGKKEESDASKSFLQTMFGG
jgi:hypothetical protein